MSDIVEVMSNWKAPAFMTLLRYLRRRHIDKTFLVDHMHVYLPTERKIKMHGLFEEISLILCLKFAYNLPGPFECAFPALLSNRGRQPISGLKNGGVLKDEAWLVKALGGPELVYLNIFSGTLYQSKEKIETFSSIPHMRTLCWAVMAKFGPQN